MLKVNTGKFLKNTYITNMQPLNSTPDSKSSFMRPQVASERKLQNYTNASTLNDDTTRTVTPLRGKVRINKGLESRIFKKVTAYWKANLAESKFKKFISRITHQYCKSSTYNTLLRYWEMFWIMFHCLTSKHTLSNDDVNILFDLWKMMNFKVTKTNEFLSPSKELFMDVKQHWTESLLILLNQEFAQVAASNDDNALGTIISHKNKNFKALVFPNNNGKLVSAVLKRRTWWKIQKNWDDYDFIWTPIIKKGNIIDY